MLDNELITLIETIRKKRNISLEELTFNIVDIKQYKKYVDHISKVPVETIVKFSNKFGMRIEDLIKAFMSAKYKESKFIVDLMNNISSYNFKEAEKLLKTVTYENFLQDENKVLHEVSILLIQFYKKIIDSYWLERELKRLISFKSIFKKELLTISEIYILGELLDVTSLENKKKISDKIISSLINNTYDYNISNLLILRLTPYLSSQNLHDDVIRLCELGIHNCHSNKSNYSLEYFYYDLAFTYNSIKHYEKRDNFIHKCYSALIASGDENTFSKFDALFIKNFDKSITCLTLEIMKKHLRK